MITVTNCNQLKLKAEDGKMRLTDVADTEQLFIISVAYKGLYTKLVALKQEIAKEKATR